MANELTTNQQRAQDDDIQHREPRVQRLWLVRHGATDWNAEQRICGHHDRELSSLGHTQALWLAKRLQKEHIAALYSSDLLRAHQTAGIVAQHALAHKLQVQIKPEWREMSFGAWEGMTYAQIAEQYKGQLDFFTDPLHHTPPGGEVFSQLVQRVQAAFQEIARASAALPTSGDIVLVSHGGPLRVLLCYLFGIPFERQWQLRIDHGSLSAIDFVVGAENVAATATLVAFNVHAPGHLSNGARHA